MRWPLTIGGVMGAVVTLGMAQSLPVPATNQSQRTKSVAALVKHHKARPDEPLLLALWLQDPARPNDIVLFEVIKDFGGGLVDPDRKFLEVDLSASTDVALRPGERLRFILTSPNELAEASSKPWPALKKLRGYEVLEVCYQDPTLGKKSLKAFKGQ